MILSLVSPFAVNKIIGVFSCLRKSRVRVRPSSPGIITSITIKSNSNPVSNLRTCAASRAAVTQNPFRDRNFCNKERIRSSSSTIKICTSCICSLIKSQSFINFLMCLRIEGSVIFSSTFRKPCTASGPASLYAVRNLLRWA